MEDSKNFPLTRRAGGLEPGAFVYHSIHGPGKVAAIEGGRIQVLFRDPPAVPFRLSHASEALVVCPPNGFIASCVEDKKAALDLLRTASRRALSLLLNEIGRDLTTREAKSVVKSLRLVPEGDFEGLWRTITSQLKTGRPTKRRRLSEGEVLSVTTAAQARELTKRLWDTDLHAADRIAVYSALSKFYSDPWSEDFFVEASVSSLPRVRNAAFKELEKRERLSALWTYLLRKTPDGRVAPGILEMLIRLLDERSAPNVVDYRAAADVFGEALKTLGATDRVDALTQLFTSSKAGSVKLSKEFLARIDSSPLADGVYGLPSTVKERVYEIACEDAPVRLTAPRDLFEFLRRVKGHLSAQDVLKVAKNAFGLKRTDYCREVLVTGADLFARTDLDNLEHLRAWIQSEPGVVDSELKAAFRRLGVDLEVAQAPATPEDHRARLLDETVPQKVRERAALELAATLDAEGVRKLLVELLQRGTPTEQGLASSVWQRWASGRSQNEKLEVLQRALAADERVAVQQWVWTALEREQLSDLLADSLTSAAIQGPPDEPLPAATRRVLQSLSSRVEGAQVRAALLATLASDRTEGGSRGGGRLAAALIELGLPTDVIDSTRRQFAELRGGIDQLKQRLAETEKRLKTLPLSEEFRAEMRAQVAATVSAKLSEARSEWELALEKTRQEAAAWYADFAAFAAALKAVAPDKNLLDIGETLRERLVMLLEKRFDLVVRDKVGDRINFEPDLYEGNARPGQEAIVVRPAIISKRSGKALEKGLVRTTP